MASRIIPSLRSICKYISSIFSRFSGLVKDVLLALLAAFLLDLLKILLHLLLLIIRA